MAAVPVTFQGILFFSDVGVGGGPMPGGPLLGIWGGGGVGNYPDAGFPGPQPGQPPRPWGPILYPDQGLPGPQPPMGGRPTHPIYYPPQMWPGKPPYMDIGFPGPQPPYPPQIWPGPGPLPYPDQGLPMPQPPGGGQPPDSSQSPSWGWAYSPVYGWIVVPGGGGGKPSPIPHPPGGGQPPDETHAPPQAGTLPSTPAGQPVKK